MLSTEQSLVITKIAQRGVLPFSFDSETDNFKIGNQEIPLNSCWENRAYEVLDTEAFGYTGEEFADIPVVFGGITKVYALPKLKKYLDSLSDEKQAKLFSDTKGVMSDAHNFICQELYGNSEYIAKPEWFAVARGLDSGMPDLVYATHTSLGPHAEGEFGEDAWPHEISKYGTNNEEMLEDRAALFAGLGHLAYKAR